MSIQKQHPLGMREGKKIIRPRINAGPVRQTTFLSKRVLCFSERILFLKGLLFERHFKRFKKFVKKLTDCCVLELEAGD